MTIAEWLRSATEELTQSGCPDPAVDARWIAEDALRMVRETHCDGVMIARGALGDPWLFERVNAALEGLPAPK